MKKIIKIIVDKNKSKTGKIDNKPLPMKKEKQ